MKTNLSEIFFVSLSLSGIYFATKAQRQLSFTKH